MTDAWSAIITKEQRKRQLNYHCDVPEAKIVFGESLVVSIATRLPFEDGIFDVCYSHTVMNFCDPEKFVQEQYRVLKPGGRMIIMDVIQQRG